MFYIGCQIVQTFSINILDSLDPNWVDLWQIIKDFGIIIIWQHSAQLLLEIAFRFFV